MEINSNITTTNGSYHHVIAELIFLPFLILIGLVGNLLVCIAILKKPKLHKVVNYFVFALAVSDLLVCAFVMPLAIYSEVQPNWYIGSGICYAWILIDVLLCTASIWNLCLVAIDRYLAITKPHAKFRTRRNAIIAIMSVWPLAILIAFLILITSHNTDEEQDFVCQIASDPSTGIISAITAFYLPCLIILVLYTKIFIVIKQKTEQRKNTDSTTIAYHAAKLARQSTTSGIVNTNVIRQQSASSGIARQQSSSSIGNISTDLPSNTGPSFSDRGSRPSVTDNPNSTASSDRASKISKMKSGKRRWTFRRRDSVLIRREMKTAIVLAIVVVSFIICWLPYFVIYMVMLNEELITDNLLIAFKVASWLGWCNSLINPIIYTIFNEDFRSAFIGLLLCRKNL